MGQGIDHAAYLLETRLADAAAGDPTAYFELGIAFSTGTEGTEVDLVQAHKWFNLAALAGDVEGQKCRADISGEMTRQEIAAAQRDARAWLAAVPRGRLHHAALPEARAA